MKFRYILSALAAGLLLFTGCEKEVATIYDEAQLSSSYVGISGDGGQTAITVNATESWSITNIPSWLTVTPASGSAGETKVVFSAEKASSTNEATVVLKVGSKSMNINVIQMTAKVDLPISTAAEIIAGPDSKSFRAKGTCTKIANTQYGNWYLTDETGEVYIYGTVDNTGAYNWASFGIEVGDEVIVEGPKTTYNGTVELVDVVVIAVNKSLIKVDNVDLGADEEGNALEAMPIEGGCAVVTLTNKGNGVTVEVPADAQGWLNIASVSTAGTTTTVTFNVAPNEGGDRETTLVFKTSDGKKDYSAQTGLVQKGAIKEVTAAEFLAAAEGTAKYRLSGIVTKLANTTYGNYYIKDATGEVYVYGTLDLEGKTKNFSSLGINEGDIITVVGTRGSYNGTPQSSNVQYESHKAVKVATAAEVNAMEDDDKNDPKNYVMVTGKVVRPTAEGRKFDLETYGNFDLVDESGDLYVYGVSTGWNGQSKMFSTLGVNEGDIITLIGYKTSYKGTNELVGMYVSHEAAKSVDLSVSEWRFDYAALDEEMAGYFMEFKFVDATKVLNAEGDPEDGFWEDYADEGTYVCDGENITMTFTDGEDTVVYTGTIDGDEMTVLWDPEEEVYLTFVKYTGEDDDKGDDDPTEVGEFDTTLQEAITVGSNAYTDGIATVNGTENVFTLKLGSSKNPGDATITLPAGTSALSFYAVGWKGSEASLAFAATDVEASQDVAANDGATGNAPYTITVTDKDKYTLTLVEAVKEATDLKITSTGRVIMFGIQAK